jgi:hypothetical protein
MPGSGTSFAEKGLPEVRRHSVALEQKGLLWTVDLPSWSRPPVWTLVPGVQNWLWSLDGRGFPKPARLTYPTRQPATALNGRAARGSPNLLAWPP